MGADTRERIITYGGWSTSDTSVQLHGVDSIDFDERGYRIAFDVVIRAATPAALTVLENTMLSVLEDRHLDLTVYAKTGNVRKFVDGTGTVELGEEGAEFIKAIATTLGTHRTGTSSAWRIVVEVTRAANQAGKPGILSQGVRTSELPNGIRRLHFKATFTPGPSNSETGDAEDRFADGTYGFQALVDGVTGTLTGDWERQGNLTKTYDEDARTLTASATYLELIFAQSATATDDPELVGANYDVVVNRGSAFSIPGQTGVAPLTAVTVLFSSAVVKTQLDLADLIDSKILPYCKAAVVAKLNVYDPLEMNHTLRADPVDNTISGQVFYLAKASTVLELSKRVGDLAKNGDNLIPVLDGTNKWKRDLWTGPGFWIRRVTLSARVLGLNVISTLDAIENAEITAMRSAGFHFLGWAVAGSPSVERFEDAGDSITTTVETRTLEFERADIRTATGGGTAGNERPPAEGSSTGGGDFLASFKERT